MNKLNRRRDHRICITLSYTVRNNNKIQNSKINRLKKFFSFGQEAWVMVTLLIQTQMLFISVEKWRIRVISLISKKMQKKYTSFCYKVICYQINPVKYFVPIQIKNSCASAAISDRDDTGDKGAVEECLKKLMMSSEVNRNKNPACFHVSQFYLLELVQCFYVAFFTRMGC